MADYKLRIDVDEAELTKKLKKAVEKAGLAGFTGGSGSGGFSKMQESIEEHTKRLNEDIRANEEILKTKYKYNSLLQKEMYARQLTMKLEARKNELLRRSGVYGRVGSTVGGLVGGRTGAAVGGVFDQLSAMFKYSKGVDKIKKQELANLEKAKKENTIDMDEYIKKKAEIEGLDADEKKARPMKLVAIGAGLLAGAGISKMIIDSSPLLQAMLKILNVGIMLILRPIGDFVGFLLRPLLIEFVKKVAIPAYKGGFKLAKQWGDSLGKQLLAFLSDPLGSITKAVYDAFAAWATGSKPTTSFIGGLAYGDGLERPEGALTPVEFLGEGHEYENERGGPTFQSLLMAPLMNFLGKMNMWFAKEGTTLLDEAIESLKGFLGKVKLFGGMGTFFDDILRSILFFIGDMNMLFQKTIPEGLKNIGTMVVNALKKASTHILMAWGKMNVFFLKTLPEYMKTLADDLAKALKGLPAKIAGWVEEAIKRVIFGNPDTNISTKTGGKNTGGFGQSYDDFAKAIADNFSPETMLSRLKTTLKNAMPGGGRIKQIIAEILGQIGGEAAYWNFGEPALKEQFPGYGEYAEWRDSVSDSNIDALVKWFENFGKQTTAPGSSSFMAYACPGETGQLVSDTFEEVANNSNAIKCTSGYILDDFINSSTYISCAMNHAKGIETSSNTARLSAALTEGHFGDIENDMAGAAAMMAALIKKVQEVLTRARIRSTKNDATSAQKQLGRAGIYEAWQQDACGNIQAPNSRKYRITWFASCGKRAGYSTTQTLSPQAYTYYNKLKQDGKIMSLFRMAKGGIINEPILGMGQKTGRHYLMGEAGPETITPGANTNPGTSGGNTFNITINAKDVGDIERQLKPTILRILKESTSRAGIV